MKPANRIVDVHTHIFNVRFIPLRDVLNRKWGVPKLLASCLAIIFNSITPGDSRPNQPERDKLLRQINKGDTFEQVSDNIFEMVKKNVIDENSACSVEDAKINLEKSLVFRQLLNIADYYRDDISPGVDEKALVEDLAYHLVISQSLKHELRRLQEADIIFDKNFKPQFVESLKTIQDEKIGKGELSFIYLMLLHEQDLYEELKIEFDQKNRDIQLYVHHMMDMEKAYSDQRQLFFLIGDN